MSRVVAVLQHSGARLVAEADAPSGCVHLSGAGEISSLHPEEYLGPFLERLRPALEGGVNVELDVTALRYVNSAGIDLMTAWLREIADGRRQVTLRYNNASPWQQRAVPVWAQVASVAVVPATTTQPATPAPPRRP